jgi:hypothetical protein
MDFKKLHEQFRDNDSPSVEGQIRWLQKQGFAQHQIEQAMITVYSELERKATPLVFTKKETHPDGGIKISRVFGNDPSHQPADDWTAQPIVNGEQFDQYLLQVAKRVRTEELGLMVKKMEEFEVNLRKKWIKEEEDKKKQTVEKPKGSWFRRKK